MPDPDTIERLYPPSGRTPGRAARRATRPAPRRRLVWLYLLIGLAGGILLSASGPLAERALALATDQQVFDDNFFTTTTLVAPSDLSASLQGHAVALSWGSGQAGTGYAVFGAATGLRGDCSEAAFASLASTADLSLLDADRSAPPGTWFCYQVQTTRGEWSSQQDNPVAAVQLGFVAASVQLNNGGDTSACGAEQYGVVDELDCGDQISVAFNQPVDTATGPGSGDTVCADQSSGTIWLGSTGSGDCTSSEDVHLGRLTGGTIGNGNSRFGANYDWNAEHTVLVVTVGARVSGSTYPTLSGSAWALTPTGNTSALLSAIGGYHICDTNAEGGNCLPEAGW
jgi:hypothetical protein